MEPVRGGALANLSQDDAEMLEALRPGASAASWAFRWLQGFVSGMSTAEQLEDNLKTFAEEKPLSAQEREVLARIADGMTTMVPCTSCRYCTRFGAIQANSGRACANKGWRQGCTLPDRVYLYRARGRQFRGAALPDSSLRLALRHCEPIPRNSQRFRACAPIGCSRRGIVRRSGRTARNRMRAFRVRGNGWRQGRRRAAPGRNTCWQGQ